MQVAQTKAPAQYFRAHRDLPDLGVRVGDLLRYCPGSEHEWLITRVATVWMRDLVNGLEDGSLEHVVPTGARADAPQPETAGPPALRLVR